MRTALLLLLLLPTLTFAQTNVSGFISANSTWTLAGSPYIVTGNALVYHNVTLTIEPGVTVKFNDSTTLQIDGELIAIGSIQSRIKFTSTQVSPLAGDWGRIQFTDSCKNAVFDTLGSYLSGTIMKYCDVLYGGGLGAGEIDIKKSSPYFSHCSISNSSHYGIYSDGSTYVIDSSSIKNCSQSALFFYYPFQTGCNLNFQCDTFVNNGGGIAIGAGPNSSCPNAHILIKNNFFRSNSGNPIFIGSDVNTIPVLISDNYFQGNSGIGTVYFEGVYRNSIIECNKFIQNITTGGANGGVISMYPGGFGGIIRNNLFDGNSSTTGTPVVANLRGEVSFSNNIVSNNVSLNSSCCNFKAPNTTRIDHNHFFNNSTGTGVITLEIESESPYIKFNNFLDSNSLIELSNSIAYGTFDIHADSNYWGGANTQHIDSVIYDYFNNGNVSVVFYLPILTKAVVLDTSCPAITLPTAVETVDKQSESTDVKVYPNPFSTQLTFSLADNVPTTVSLYDFLGQQVLQQAFTNSTTINTEQMQNGIYFYELRNSKVILKTGKVVKQ